MGVQGHTLPEIAAVLNKHRSSVWREVRRNKNEGGIYLPSHASAKLDRRRLAARVPKRIIENDLQLEMYVEKLLRYGLSPDQVSGYMRRSRHGRPVSCATVYRWVHRGWQSRKALLRYRGKPRVPYGTRKDSWDTDKRHISERPQFVRKRERVGDWEGDLVHGTQDDSRHCLLTLNERSTGFCIIRKLAALDATSVANRIVEALEGLPVETITFDNGFEFGRHKLMEHRLGCHVYFTDPNSPQQRGSNENLNGLIRQYFPKGQSLAHVTQLHATEVATRLNGRPRKRYGYEAPRRLFAEKTGRSVYFIR
jgi:IS30 family transposase